MSYTALYRNFRPLKFEDMVGQEHIKKTLINQVVAGRVGHAYLFTGGRGTGKTTSAKILARAVNCLNPQNGEPCNECEICREILEGSLTDVVEMDAASNNSVEDIRTIRDEVNFLPTKAKYRVYIIDEVHMLSIGAFNALLKTLEEPPEHVKFILATTEPQKLPTTILSRCQRFDFKKISESDIIKRLKIICKEANIKIDEDALKIIAILSEGHMRDAISILERCSQENVENIKVKDVKDLVGLPSLEYVNKISRGILENNEIIALEAVEDIIKEGKDLYNFLWEIIKYFKDILVYKSTSKIEMYSENEILEIKKLSDSTDSQRLLEIIYLLSEIENDIKWAAQKTIMFQVGIIKACRNENSSENSEQLLKRIEVLENKLSSLNSKELNQTTEEFVPKKEKNTEVKIFEKNAEKKPEIKSNGKATDVWKKVIETLKKDGKIRLYTALINTNVNEVSDLVWEIEFPNGLTSFNEKILQDVNNKNDLVKEIFKILGKEIHIKYVDKKRIPNQSKTNTISDLGIDINVID